MDIEEKKNNAEENAIDETLDKKQEESSILNSVKTEDKEEDRVEDKVESKENVQEDIEENKCQIVKGKRKQVKMAVAVISITILIFAIMFISTIFALVNLGNDKIIDGIRIKNISLVGLSKEDAKLEIEEAIQNELSKNVLLRYENYETSISPEQIEASYDIDKAIEEAYGSGRNGNIVKNNYDILFAMLFGKEISLEFTYNDEILTDMIIDISKKIPGSMKDNSYYIEGEKLVITKGKSGLTIKIEEMKKEITAMANSYR